MTKFSSEKIAKLYKSIVVEELFEYINTLILSRLCWIEKKIKVLTNNGNLSLTLIDYLSASEPIS